MGEQASKRTPFKQFVTSTLQVPKMAENKQEPRQLQKPRAHECGRTDGLRVGEREEETAATGDRQEGPTGRSQMEDGSKTSEVEGSMEALKGRSCD